MRKSSFIREYRESVNSKAEFDEKAVSQMTRLSQSLNPDLVYVIPAQWIHAEKLAQPFNGRDISNRVYMFGIDDDEVKTITSISINSLRAMHYGTENKDLEVEKNDNGLLRIKRGQVEVKTVITDNGKNFNVPLRADGKAVAIAQDFAIQLTDRKEVMTTSYSPNAKGGYDIDTVTKGGKKFAKLSANTSNLYSVVNIPEDCDYDAVIDGLEDSVKDSFIFD